MKSVREMVDCEIEGRVREYQWVKTPSQTTTARLWFDLALSPGNPPAKFYFDAPPLIAKQITQSADGGIFHGSAVTPYSKYLRRSITLSPSATPIPMRMILLDYLLYYPTIDDSVTDPQLMDNTVTLGRYTTGEGVQMIAVSLAGRVGGASFTVSYTNSEGVAGRTSEIVFQNSSAAIGTILYNGINNNISAMPFIGLQSGDRGVRSIESITMITPDVGLFALVLVKPIGTTLIKELGSPVEIDYFIHKNEMPRIYDNAFLNYICLPNGSLSAISIQGDLKVIWDN